MAAWDNDPVVGQSGQPAAQPSTPPAWASDEVLGEMNPQAMKSDVQMAKESLSKIGWEDFKKNNLPVRFGGWALEKSLLALGAISKEDVEFNDKLHGRVKEPEDNMSYTDQVKAGLKLIKDKPLTATAELAKGLINDPELLGLGALKSAATVDKMMQLAKAGRAMRAVAATGATAVEGGVVMGSYEALSQVADKKELNTDKIGASATMGAVAAPLMAGAGKLVRFKGTPSSAESSGTPTLDRFQETVKEGGEIHNPVDEAFRQPPASGPANDKLANAMETAYDLMKRGASKKEVEKAIKNNPELGEAMEKIRERRADAKDSFNRAIQGEVLPPEAASKPGSLAGEAVGQKSLSSPKPTDMFRRQAGGADPKMLAAIGLVGVGALAGSYLAGDHKVAGAIFGGIAGAGALRLPNTLAGLGKTLSYKTALTNSAKVGMILGAGAYIGSKSDDPVAGAAMAGAILLGRNALKPAQKLVTDDMIAIRNGNIAAYERIVGNLKRDIETAVPDKGRREVISDALDQGDPSKLTPEERKVYSAVRGFYDSIGKEGVDAEVLKGMRHNYISYIVERDPAMTHEQESGIIASLFESGAFSGNNASPNTKFAKHGKYESFSELNKALEGSGLRLKTKDVSELISIYGRSMRAAIENKLLMNNLKGAKSPTGESYLTHQDANGNVPHGYKRMNHPQLSGYGVHPDLVDSLKVVMDNSDPNIVTRGLLGLGMAVKRVQVMGSLFHAKSLAEVYINAMGRDVYSQGKAPIDAALKMFREGGVGDTLDLGIRNGLSMKVPHDIDQSIIANIGKSIDQLVPKITGGDTKVGSAVAEKVDWVNKKLDKITWDYMHAGVKGAIFLKEFETMMARNAEAHARDPKIPLKTKEQIAKEVAKYANDLTGGLDWFGIAADAKTQLGRNLGMFFAGPSGQRMAQILAFAPDWAVSTLRAGFNAFGKSDSGLKGIFKPSNTTDLYRKYAMRSALYWLTILNGFNIAFSGHPVWQNQDPTRIDMGDGTSVQAGKHTFEAVHAVSDPARFAYNKLGFTPKMVVDFFSGKEGYGDKAPAYSSFPRHMMETAEPFIASAGRQSELSIGERIKRGTMSFAGFPKYGYTDEQKQARRESRKIEREKKRRRKMEIEY